MPDSTPEKSRIDEYRSLFAADVSIAKAAATGNNDIVIAPREQTFFMHRVYVRLVPDPARLLFERDPIPFTFVSDEFNGGTLDREGNIRPLMPRRFKSLSEAEEENVQSRTYLGIHRSFDKREGILQGQHVADHVFNNALPPMH